MAMKRQCYSVLTGRTQNFSKSNSTQLNPKSTLCCNQTNERCRDETGRNTLF